MITRATMPRTLLTLTSDFGQGSAYVAAMKGALLAVDPDARLMDLNHGLPAQDVRYCSIFLRSALPWFPPGTLHVVVVDPGVGTERALLYVETGGQRLLVPDNGCWTELARLTPERPLVIRLTERRYWRADVSPTFHGRDILAPVAGHLSCGLDPRHLGSAANTWVEWFLPMPQLLPDRFVGEVVFIDGFGNLITNLPGETYLRYRDRFAGTKVGEHRVTRQVRTYGEAEAGTLVVLVSSSGAVEVAEVNGNAARRLGAAVGTPVAVMLEKSNEA
jgi:S-adenosylmethionine hydrolase